MSLGRAKSKVNSMLTKGNHAHYEISIERILRNSSINYVGTNEKKKALTRNGKKLKNFDVLINTKKTLLIDFKGKQFSYKGAVYNNWENWLPINHVTDLIHWESEFNFKVSSLLVFIFKLSTVSDSQHFKDTYRHKGVDYGVVAISPHQYLKHSKPRAKGIINVSRSKFKTIVKPLSYYIPEIKYK